MEEPPMCRRCRVQVVFLRHTKSEEGKVRSLFECPSCFIVKSEPTVFVQPAQ
jgi:hypothetical protein